MPKSFENPEIPGVDMRSGFVGLGGTWVPPKLESPAPSQMPNGQPVIEVRIFRVSIHLMWLSKVGKPRDLGPVA